MVSILLVSTLMATTPADPVGAIPEGFEATNVITGLQRPTNLEFSPDGRIFIAEQSGLVKVFDDQNDTTPTIAADLRDQTHSVDGRGLLGLALDPDFPTTPHMYVMYAHDAPIGGTAPTYGNPGANNDECPVPPGPGKCVVSGRISRLVLSGDVAVSETVILEDWCQEWTSHSIGDLRFGPDGALYASAGEGAFAGQPDWGQRAGQNGCGDPPIPHGGTGQDAATAEGGALRSQDLRTPGDPAGLSGTVIRIDKNTGAAHPDNPNFGHADPNVARIIGYGFRNPYRTTFRPGTEELWVGDVGWNDWEEINLIDDPDNEVYNFGWPCYEGPDLGYDIGSNICADLIAEGPGAVEPAYFAYEQKVSLIPPDDGCLNNNGSPSALTFYEIGAYPAEYDGAFFFGDYSRRCIWSMLAGDDGRPDASTVRLILDDVAVTDLERGPGGDIYALNIFGGGPIGGTLVRLSYPDGEIIPNARLTSDVTDGPVPLAVRLDASTSSPGAPGDTLTYDWDLDGDGSFGDASTDVVDHTYAIEGRYSPQVKVTDQNGGFSTASLTIFAGTPPTVTITAPTTGTSWIVDDDLVFAGSAVDGQGAPIAATELQWDLILHHCETLDDCHTHVIGTIEGVDSGSFQAPEHEYPSFIEVNLTATAPSGLTATQSLDLFPDTAVLTLTGTPAGVEAGFNGKAVATPSTHEVIVGSTNALSAAPVEIIGARSYDFDSWSDGGAITHDAVVTEDQTIDLAYVETPVASIIVEDVTIAELTGQRAVATFPVRLSRPHNASVRVRVRQVAGTASLGSDIVKWSPKTIYFPPGATERSVDVKIQGDDIDELDENFFLEFYNPVNAPLYDSLAEGTILDDESLPAITINDKRLLEGNGSGTKSAVFTVRLSHRSDRPITVDVATAPDTATADVDYESVPPTSLTLAPGRRSISTTVKVIRDNEPEGDETAFVRLSNPTNAVLGDPEGILTITDDEPALSINDVRLFEGVANQRTMRFTVRMSKRATGPVSVDWTTADGSAVAPADYIAASGTVVIPKGSTSRTLTVSINGDTVPEPDETYSVLLSGAVGASIADGEGIGTIRSDDYQPKVSIADAAKNEAGTSVKLVVTLDQAVTKTTKVTYTTADGSAIAPDDYAAKGPQVLSFSAGSTRRTISITIKHDTIAEGDEIFTVLLSNPVGSEIVDGEGIVTILDND